MWRKPTESKPSSQGSNAPTPAPVPAPVKSAPAPATVATATMELKPAVQETPVVQKSAAPAPVSSAPISQPAVSRDRGGASVISSGLKIRGEVSGNADLVIDGELQGKITLTASKVTVGANGRVNADIEAGEIVIEGTVNGNLKARDSLRLGASSRVEGSVLTPRVAIEDGARLRGKVEMIRAGEPRNSSVAVPAPKPEVAEPVHAPVK